MTKPNVKRARIEAFHKQEGHCFYCEVPMWEATAESKAEARVRLGLPIGEAGAGIAVRRRLCTAEHLVRRADGGLHAGNIVAACQGCNVRRGDMTPEDFRELRRPK